MTNNRLIILTFGRDIIAEASVLSWTITRNSNTRNTGHSGVVAISEIKNPDFFKSEDFPPVDIHFIDMEKRKMIQLLGVELLDSGYALKAEDFKEGREYQFVAKGIWDR